MFNLMIRSRPNLEESIEDKHRRFVAVLAKIENGWGLAGKEPLRLKNKKQWSEFGTSLSLKGFLGKGIKGTVSYYRRETIAYLKDRYGEQHVDDGSYDDYFTLDFDPAKVDYQALTQKAFFQYVTAFAAYVGSVNDVEFTHLDFEAWRKLPPRGGVERIGPLAFWDREFCLRAFHLTPEQVKDRLESDVDQAVLLAGGVLVVATGRVVTLQEADAINRKLKPLLTGKRVRATPRLDNVAAEANAEKKVGDSKKKAPASLPKQGMQSLARAVIGAMMFLELSDEDAIEERAAVKAMEALAYELRQTSAAEQAALRAAVKAMTKEEKSRKARPEVVEFLVNFMDSLGLEDPEE